MSEALNLAAVVRVDNSGAVAPLKETANAITATKTAADTAAKEFKTAGDAAKALGGDAKTTAAGMATAGKAAKDAAREVREFEKAAKGAHGGAADLASGAKFGGNQLLELGHIGKSVFGELAAGQSVFRALAVEGGRIGQVVAGSGGPLATLGKLTTLVGGPMVAGLGLAAVAAAGLGYAMYAAATAAEETNAKLKLSGNVADLSAHSIDELGAKLALATGASRSLATELVSGLATSGKVTRDEIDDATRAAIGLSKATGETAEKIVESFAKASDGPTAYAVESAKSYSILDAAQIAQIRQLEDMGDKAGAAKLLFKDLSDYFGSQGVAQANLLTRAYRELDGALTSFFAGGVQRVERLLGTQTEAAKLSAQRAGIAAQIEGIANSTSVRRGYPVAGADAARLATLRGQLGIVDALAAATARESAAVAEHNRVQRDGIAASQELSAKYAGIGDNARKTTTEIAKFRATLAAALKANPNDATALDLQKRAREVEGKIRDRNEPAAAAAAKKADSDAASAAKRAQTAADGLVKSAAAHSAALQDAIAKLELEATAAGEVKVVGEETLKVFELQKVAHRELTELERARIADAVQLKNLYLGVAQAIKAASGDLGLPQGSIGDIVKAQDATRQKDRVDSGLDKAVSGLEDKFDGGFYERFGHKLGDASGKGIESAGLTAATAIGQAIGGKAGGALATLAGAFQGARTGNYTSLGGRAGGLLTLASGIGQGGAGGSAASLFGDSFKSTFSAPFNKIASKLDDFFGGGAKGFAGTAGKAFAGAAQGQIAGSVLSGLGIKTSGVGSQIGGALGSLIPGLGPFGGLIGGALGGIIGGLFTKKTTGSSTVSASGGEISVGAGTGNDAEKNKQSVQAGGSLSSAIEQLIGTLGGKVGTFSTSIGVGSKGGYVVDFTGTGKTKTGNSFKTQEEALQVALGDVIRDGGVSGVSAKVQAVLQKYSNDVNKAVSEALKVKGLEDLLATQENPFATYFRDFETQAKERLSIATKYGFDVVAIEKINAKQRAAVLAETLAKATQGVKQLLDDFRFGSRATGSVGEQQASLGAERDRLTALVRGGDDGQLGALTSVIQQLDDLNKQAFGSTGQFAEARSSATALLNELLKSTEDRIKAASDAAKGPDATVAKLTELNGTADDQTKLQQQILEQLKLNGGFFGGGGGGGVSFAGLYQRSVFQ